ncbi:hypothetical protein HU675_0038245 [Bradyrhizobium septentrionale]|uniref:hypothetical protein n=1 Tax=Bradyrhizobium septentrionale TaxID=1404411 RepID=UPI001597048C|nr:hypothetical protein [Bradyrhizobium septentrionale]UGY23728.1 hypothetical protein HU675_0038245 [Bradyrhizobium septentrionale]
MASSFLDVCRFISGVAGTADFTVGSALAGYQTPSTAGAITSASYSYRAESADLTLWEIGIGTWSGTTLGRQIVLANSLGTTGKISFSTTPIVGIGALSADLNTLRGDTNALRNGCFDIWQRGTSFTNTATGTFQYGPDGWMLDSVGAACTIAQVFATGNSQWAAQITGATSNTDVQLMQRIESNKAAKLAGRRCTLQALITNNSGATITPTAGAAFPNAVDNWTTATNDLNAVSFQSIPNNGVVRVALTFLVSLNAKNGYEVWFDFGALNANTKTIAITEVDLQPTPSFPAGLTSFPPPIFFRDPSDELMLAYRYLYPVAQGQVGLGTSIVLPSLGARTSSTTIDIPVSLPLPMRIPPFGFVGTTPTWQASNPTSGNVVAFFDNNVPGFLTNAGTISVSLSGGSARGGLLRFSSTAAYSGSQGDNGNLFVSPNVNLLLTAEL